MTREAATFSDALSFPLEPVVRRYQREFGVDPQRAARVEQEVKRFLIICAYSNTGGLQPPAEVDRFWHIFLLFTNEYSEFCRVLGRGFIHHRPTEAGQMSSSALSERSSSILWRDYVALFGENPPADIWQSKDGTALSNCDTSGDARSISEMRPGSTSIRLARSDCDARKL